MRDQRDRIGAAGGSVVLVGLGSPQRAGAFCREKGVDGDFACLTDPTRAGHRAYGLVRGAGRTLRPRNLGRWLRLNRSAETRQARAGGDVWQQGGLFVIDRSGVVRYAHRSEDPGDHAPLEDVLSTLARIGRDEEAHDDH